MRPTNPITIAFTISLLLAGCGFFADDQLATCVDDAQKLLSLSPTLSWKEIDPNTGRSFAVVDRLASESGMSREDFLVRACMRTNGYAYDAESRDWKRQF